MSIILDSTDLGENADREGPGLQLIYSLSSKTSLAPTFKRNLISTAHCLHSSAC